VLAKRSIIDLPTTILAASALLLVWRFRKLPEPLIVAGAAAVGLIAYPLLYR
jgi:chromate transporter